MPRLFTGLELPQSVRTRLSLVRAPLPGAKWVEPEDFHITLRFAGDIDNRVADEFAGFLDEIEAPALDISISGVGFFGGRSPRVIWAGVDGGVALASLQKAHERAARRAGLEPDPQTFRPHVTLARLRGTRPDAVARFLSSRGGLKSEPFRINRFALFSARPGSGGGPYVVEHAYRLGDGDRGLHREVGA
jgi:RNA 2',3'-cyclic 3'-phosphodiesterase